MIRYIHQIAAYIAFSAVVVVFANGPSYRILGSQEAMVSLTFSHAGARVGDCRTLTQDELNELPPNMRKPNECPRERHPVHIKLSNIAGEQGNERLLIEEELAPSGIWSDGKANVYRRITLQSGDYRFIVRMNDSGRNDGFDYEQTEVVSIRPGQNLVISFDELEKTFTFE